MVEVRRLQSGDEAAAIAGIHELKPAAERGGQDASPEHMRRLLADDRNHLYVARVQGRPAGYLLAYRFPRIDRDREMVYLYEIDVVPEHRRQGIGTEMIRRLKADCRRRQVLKVWVGTEADNVAARALYESTGARCEGESYAEYVYEEL